MFHDVLQQAADLTAGHGVLRYTGPISVSTEGMSDDDFEHASRIIHILAAPRNFQVETHLLRIRRVEVLGDGRWTTTTVKSP